VIVIGLQRSCWRMSFTVLMPLGLSELITMIHVPEIGAGNRACPNCYQKLIPTKFRNKLLSDFLTPISGKCVMGIRQLSWITVAKPSRGFSDLKFKVK